MTRTASIVALASIFLTACAELGYYGQALSGQWQVLNLRRPLNELMTDPATPAALQERLTTARSLRDFASTELALPDNDSYRNYADLGRPYVVWNVFAAPPLSLKPHKWCFPLIGCVSYRGYFDHAAAQETAEKLHAQGYDVFVAGIPAYSTLGWFDDPLLNTFVFWPAGRLAELVFHELAHQRVFVAGDTEFNESFASFVGQQGVRLWLDHHGTPEDREAYRTFARYRDEFMHLVLPIKEELTTLYASELPDEAKREGKRRLLADLKDRYARRKQEWGGYHGYDGWFARDLNNAKLAALNAYTRFVPAFEALYERSGRNFGAFYRAVEAIAELPPPAREARLQGLMEEFTHAGDGPSAARNAGPNIRETPAPAQ